MTRRQKIAQAYEHYEHIMRLIQEEYQQVVRPAWEEYQRVAEPVQQQHDRVKQQAWAEFVRIEREAKDDPEHLTDLVRDRVLAAAIEFVEEEERP